MRALCAALLFALVMFCDGALAQPSVQDQLATPPPQGLREQNAQWQREKCDRYMQAWAQATVRRGVTGLSPDFLSRHNVFLTSGCIEGRNVCPRTREELDMANTLVLLGMNAGMSGTFFPFSCKAD